MEHAAGRTVGPLGPVASVRAAFGMLTRLPVGEVVDDPGASAFALVGAVVGLLGAVPLVLLGLAGEPALGAIASVATLAAVSGGLHLDGLADTADAMIAPDLAAAERARQDPGVGPAGVVTLLIVLGGQVAALASVSVSAGAVVAGALLVVGGSLSRWLPVLAVVLLRSRAAPDGLGAWFGARVSAGDAVVGASIVTLTTAAAAALVGLQIMPGAIFGVIAGLFGTAVGARTRRRLDGDALGAAVEVALTATLVGVAVIAP